MSVGGKSLAVVFAWWVVFGSVNGIDYLARHCSPDQHPEEYPYQSAWHGTEKPVIVQGDTGKREERDANHQADHKVNGTHGKPATKPVKENPCHRCQ
jgi:hypothetical protein